MKALQELIARHQHNTSTPKLLDEQTILFAVRKVIQNILGSHGGVNIVAEHIRGKRLILSASSSLWVNEAHLLRDEIKKQTNTLLGMEVIQEVIARLKS